MRITLTAFSNRTAAPAAPESLHQCPCASMTALGIDCLPPARISLSLPAILSPSDYHAPPYRTLLRHHSGRDTGMCQRRETGAPARRRAHRSMLSLASLGPAGSAHTKGAAGGRAGMDSAVRRCARGQWPGGPGRFRRQTSPGTLESRNQEFPPGGGVG